MFLVSAIENSLALLDEWTSLPVMHGGRRQQLQGRVMMQMVIPVEELLAEAAGILDGSEAVRIIGTILHGFEVSFRKGIVIGNVRTTVSLDDA